MIDRITLLKHVDELLEVSSIRDYCPNGLQVEGRQEIRRIITGVTACQPLLDEAVRLNADAVLVHHGYFWKGEAMEVVGIKKQRLATLLKHDINLMAYHLPLDVHKELGNNVVLAEKMSWHITGPLELGNPLSVGVCGELADPCSAAELTQRLQRVLGQAPLHIAGGAQTIKTIAWCTGAAQSMLDQAVAAGVDAFVTGEVSEPTVHLAREAGIHFYAAGHHATERYGVQALGEHLAKTYNIEHTFVDIPNPV